MRSRFFISGILLFLTLLVQLQIHAQNKGNIVEYFGKDHNVTTDEGKILHVFNNALVLRESVKPGMLTGPQDFIAYQLAKRTFERPFQGLNQIVTWGNDVDTLVWEAIKADSTGSFTGNQSRSYVYMEWESDKEMTVLLDATGHTRAFINGMPHEGDHYDYGYTLIPVTLKKGLNQFLFFYGRFARIRAKLILPGQLVQLSKRDMTLSPILVNENEPEWGAVRLLNCNRESLQGYSITCQLETSETLTTPMDYVISMTTRKVKFKVPSPKEFNNNLTIKANLTVNDPDGKKVHQLEIDLKQQIPEKHHERTFISSIDGSVQYYSVAPSLSADSKQALVLSTHGASVEATNQTRAYKQKDWAHIVAPTNRRPFGFNWEEWGRKDALEVLHQARMQFSTDTSQTYLTGHSMGGHGSWFLGATYPDKFAAFAPAAGYPDIIGYRKDGSDTLSKTNPHFEIIYRAASAGRTLDLARNYLQSGVYILHGGADNVVPVEQARKMREKLGAFHTNFSYYEYPGGSHWYGDHCMDWPPLFDFLRQNKIPLNSEVNHIEFYTSSPAVSATNYWISVNRQITPWVKSYAIIDKMNDSVVANLTNIQSITFNFSKLNFDQNPLLVLNGQSVRCEKGMDITLDFIDGAWKQLDEMDSWMKNPVRSGSFKMAFDNEMLFVYTTQGSSEENEWYLNKARFDAETFLYRGNGSVDIIPDTSFNSELYLDRNVIIYGNAANNMAWDKLLIACPVRVEKSSITFGDRRLEGENLGCYFVYPRTDNPKTSVGVIAGTGYEGMRSVAPNDYFSGITGFPDLMIFQSEWLKDGPEGIIISGFFGNDWSIETGDFAGK